MLKLNKDSLIIAVLFGVVFTFICNVSFIAALLPEIMREYKINAQLGGYLLTFYAIMSGTLTLICGPIYDIFGRKKILYISTFIFGITILLTALSWNYESLLIFRTINGIAAAPIIIGAYSYIPDYFNSNKIGSVFGIVTSAVYLGSVLGIPLSSLIAFYSGWKFCFIILGLINLILAFFIYVYFIDIPTGKEKQKFNLLVIFRNYLDLFKKPLIFWILIFTFLIFIAFNSINTFISVWFNKVFQYDLKQIAKVFFFSGLLSLLGSIIIGRMTRKLSLFKLIFSGCVLGSIFHILFTFETKYDFYYISIFSLISFAVTLRLIPLQVIIGQTPIETRGSVNSLFTTSGQLAMAFAPVLGSLVLNQYTFDLSGNGFMQLNLILSVLLILAGGVLFLIKKYLKK